MLRLVLFTRVSWYPIYRVGKLGSSIMTRHMALDPSHLVYKVGHCLILAAGDGRVEVHNGRLAAGGNHTQVTRLRIHLQKEKEQGEGCTYTDTKTMSASAV